MGGCSVKNSAPRSEFLDTFVGASLSLDMNDVDLRPAISDDKIQRRLQLLLIKRIN